MKSKILGLIVALLIAGAVPGCSEQLPTADLDWLDACNVVWTSPSENSSESMPVGGGDIGLNVWVEDGELLIYMARAGCFDEDGKFVIYLANTLEHHPNARNPSLPIVGMHQILTRLLELPEKYCPPQRQERWREIMGRMPDLPVERDVEERRILKPAENYSHRSWHMPEMYGLWPFQVYGLGLYDLELMQNTFLHGVSNRARESVDAWTQGFIHYARLGMAKKSQKMAVGKLGNGPYRFPAFWPEDIDWVPDFNWGGAGMVGLQEMLLQTHLPAPASLHDNSEMDTMRINDGGYGKLRLVPAWPEDWDVDFKLFSGLTSSSLIYSNYDRPMWRYDSGRRAFAKISLPDNPVLLWIRQPEEPSRYWTFQFEDYYTSGNPDRIGKLPFDISYEPVVGGDKLFVPSMISDRLTA